MQNWAESVWPVLLGLEAACCSQVCLPPLQFCLFCRKRLLFGIQSLYSLQGFYALQKQTWISRQYDLSSHILWPRGFSRRRQIHKLLPFYADHLGQSWQQCWKLHVIQTVCDAVENLHKILLNKTGLHGDIAVCKKACIL